MLDVLRGDTIRGVVFSNYDEFGYQNLYSFPPPIEELDIHLPIDKSIFQKWQQEKDHFFPSSIKESQLPPTKQFGGLNDIELYTERDFLQIAVKSISLLIGEKVMEKDPSLLDMNFYGILPYPDLQVYSYTFFRFYSVANQNIPRACTFSLLIDKAKKNFIYENHDFLNGLIHETVSSLVSHLENGEWKFDRPSKEVIERLQGYIMSFFSKLMPISGLYSHPSALDIHHTKKIVFVGIQNSGKNSFLLTLNRKYNKLVSQDNFQNGDLHIAQILGTTVLNWEIENDDLAFEEISEHFEIYLNDADMIYFFVDGSNLQSIDQSENLFSSIIQYLTEIRLSIPLIIIISKIDKDIKNSETVQANIANIKHKFTNILNISRYPSAFRFYETSIYIEASCLSAFSGGLTLLLEDQTNITGILQHFSENYDIEALMLFNESGLAFSRYTNPTSETNAVLSYHPFEFLGTKLINIFEKSRKSVISSDISIISASFNETCHIVLKKIDSTYNFYVLACYNHPPPPNAYENLSVLANRVINSLGNNSNTGSS